MFLAIPPHRAFPGVRLLAVAHTRTRLAGVAMAAGNPQDGPIRVGAWGSAWVLFEYAPPGLAGGEKKTKKKQKGG